MQLKRRILIIDDNPSDRLIVRSLLHKLGYREIQEAEDGSIAAKKIQTALDIHMPFDLIFLDWNMPKTTGQKLLHQIRNNPKTKNAQIIVMTATADLTTVEDAIQGGVNDFIVKPVAIDALKEKIDKLPV